MIDLSSTKTAFPMIQDGQYAKFKLEAIKEGRSEKGPFLAFEWHLVDPAPDTDGGQILPGKPGSKMFENIQLYAKPDAVDPEWFKKKISTRIDAVLGTGDADNKKGKPPRPNLTPETVAAMTGQCLIAKMKVTTYEGTTRNEFASVSFPGDIEVKG